MANYTLHLGYNLDSPTIGSIWSSEASSSRFLQYALGDDAAAAWFSGFQDGDDFSIQLWDLSSESDAKPDACLLKLSLSRVSAADAGTQTYQPSWYMEYGSTVAQQYPKTVNGITNYYLQVSPVTPSYAGPYSGPWGSCRGQSAPVGPLTFRLYAGTPTPFRFKLSFELSVMVDDRSVVFLGDPEVIVSSTG